MRTYVFGDTGGHLAQLRAGLERIGVDLRSSTIPDDVRIIHAGDLIHKGPKSNELVSLVNQLMLNNPEGAWIQIAGNHELHHLGGYQFWSCDCTPETIRTLHQWFYSGDMRIAHAFHGRYLNLPCETNLVTHAGATPGFLGKMCASLSDPFEMARVINDGARLTEPTWKTINRPGLMLGAEFPDLFVGPIWAQSLFELYPSWQTVPMNFNQIHGHNSLYRWDRGGWYHKVTSQRYDALMINTDDDATRMEALSPLADYSAHMSTIVGDRRLRATYCLASPGPGVFIGVDPGFESKEPNISLQPAVCFES